jgi:hypothetical protein
MSIQMFYYVAKSRRRLKTVCELLRNHYCLPEFTFDSHDNWRYAWSSSPDLRFNVTKAQGFSTVETWLPDCPKGVNFQIIVECECEPLDIHEVLADALDASAMKIWKRAKPENMRGKE